MGRVRPPTEDGGHGLDYLNLPIGGLGASNGNQLLVRNCGLIPRLALTCEGTVSDVRECDSDAPRHGANMPTGDQSGPLLYPGFHADWSGVDASAKK